MANDDIIVDSKNDSENLLTIQEKFSEYANTIKSIESRLDAVDFDNENYDSIYEEPLILIEGRINAILTTINSYLKNPELTLSDVDLAGIASVDDYDDAVESLGLYDDEDDESDIEDRILTIDLLKSFVDEVEYPIKEFISAYEGYLANLEPKNDDA